MKPVGPLEFLAVAFPGEGLPEGSGAALERIHEAGDVRTVEAMLIIKSNSGVVRTEDFTEVAGLATIPANDDAPDVRTSLVDPADVTAVSAAMPDDSTVLALLFEHRRAQDVVSVFRDIGGVVLASTRLPESGVAPNRPSIIGTDG
jgi:hypothetical protein